MLTSYTLEYIISMYSCPKVTNFEFLKEPRGSFLCFIPLSIKILIITLSLESFPMAI